MLEIVQQPPSAANNAVCNIDEVLRFICQYCDKPTLAALARVNKTICGPALDALWATLTNFAHLLRLLPDDLISWSSPVEGLVVPTVNDLIIPRMWKRFNIYASRVRRWSSEDLSYIQEALIDHIAFGKDPGYILPRLTHMDVGATTVSGIHLQILISCPTLQSVTVWNTEPTHHCSRAMPTLFKTLADRATNLREFILHWGTGENLPQTFKDGLLDVFTLLQNLQNVHLWSPHTIDHRSFQSLASLPKLNTLHLNLVGANMEEFCTQIQAPSHHFSFPALYSLHLGGELEHFTKLLAYFHNDQMTTIGFTVRDYPKASALRKLFQGVSSCFRTTLQTLQFFVPKEELLASANRTYSGFPEHYTITYQVIEPLSAITGLTTLHLELGVPMHLTDDDLSMIGFSWPRIQVLNLCPDPYCDRAREVQPQPTFHGVFHLLEQCRSLHTLGLFVNYITQVNEDLVANCCTVSTSVVRYDAGKSWIANPALVAALFSGCFPSLEVFMWSGSQRPETWSETSGYSPGWKQVLDLLPVFNAARLNERQKRSALKLEGGD